MLRIQFLYLTLASCFIYWIGKIIYNLFIHPLSKYPGPWYLGANRLVLTYHILTGSQVQWTRALHEKYGLVVRTGPNDLSYTDERAWQDVLGSTPAAKYGMPKDEGLARLIGDEMTNPNAAIPHAEQKHTRMRRAFAPALTKQALRLQSPMILGHVDQLIDTMHQRSLDPINMVEMYAFCVYNIFTDLFLGESLDLFKSDTYHAWVGSFTGFAKGTTMMGALHHFPVMRYVLKAVLLTVGKSQRDAFLSVCFERFDRRLAAAATSIDRPDLLHFAMGSTSEKSHLSTEELRDFAPFLIIGGGETTPTLLSGLTYLLLNDEPRRARLTAEIHAHFPPSDDEDNSPVMTMDALSQLPYLNACINEALRLYPPIAGAVERVVPPGGASILGTHVPGGTLITLCHHAMYHVSHNFHDPDAFRPERWLPAEEAGPAFRGDHRGAFRPFSIGNQSCIGQELAHFITRLILCTVLRTYDMDLVVPPSPPPGAADDDATEVEGEGKEEDWMTKQSAFFTWIKPPLLVRVRRRG